MGEVIYLFEHWHQERKEKRRREFERKNGFKLDMLLEKVGVINERRRQEVLRQAQRLADSCRHNNDNGGKNVS